MSSALPRIRLRNGALLPLVGFGTWPLDDRTTERVVADALAVGHRLVDTAELYGNESGVGRAIRRSSVAREDIFVTTKLSRRWHGADLVARGVDGALTRLGLDYVDLLLVHWPNPDLNRYVSTWTGLAAELERGRVRAIGTSNFTPSHLTRIINATGVIPDVAQIQLSPGVARADDRVVHRAHGIVTQSWSPLGGPGARATREPVVRALAAQLARTPAQVVLRWHIEIGAVPIAKSTHRARLHENLQLFDFELTPAQIQQLGRLDGRYRAIDSDRMRG